MKLTGKQMLIIKDAVGSNGTPTGLYLRVSQTKTGYIIKNNDPRNQTVVAVIDGLTREATINDQEKFDATLEYWSEE